MRSFQGRTYEEMQQLNEDEQYKIDVYGSIYFEELMRAIRAGIHNHPRIRGPLRRFFFEFIHTHRVLGNWELLRKARGFEVGVKRPRTEEQVDFLNAVNDVIDELRWGGKKPEISLEDDDNEVASQFGQSVLEIAFQRARRSRVFNPENPPPQPREKPISISEVHRELTRKGVVKSKLQPFRRRLERLNPNSSLFRKKRRNKG